MRALRGKACAHVCVCVCVNCHSLHACVLTDTHMCVCVRARALTGWGGDGFSPSAGPDDTLPPPHCAQQRLAPGVQADMGGSPCTGSTLASLCDAPSALCVNILVQLIRTLITLNKPNIPKICICALVLERETLCCVHVLLQTCALGKHNPVRVLLFGLRSLAS